MQSAPLSSIIKSTNNHIYYDVFFFQAFQMSNLIREYMEKIVEGQEKNQVVMSNGNEVTMVYGNE